jgi:outer membrane immunogenic protein
MKSFLLAGVAVAAISAIGFAGAASAADLRMPAKAAPMPVQSSAWSGCYAGLHIGAAQGRTKWADTLPGGAIDTSFAGNVASTDMSGATYGGQLGCDFQFGGPLVFGVEGSLSGTTLSGTDTDQFNPAWTLHSTNDWLASVTGRVGFTAGQALIYARGGIAWANTQFEISNAGILTGNPSTRRQGWVVGGGLEWAFTRNWSVFVEGDYYTFNGTNVNFAGDLINPTPAFTVRTKQDIETVKLGVNYRFGNPFGF